MKKDWKFSVFLKFISLTATIRTSNLVPDENLTKKFIRQKSDPEMYFSKSILKKWLMPYTNIWESPSPPPPSRREGPLPHPQRQWQDPDRR